MKKILLLLTILSSSVYGQTIFRIDTGGLRQTCNAVFTDDGGITHNYNNNRNEIITFQPVDSSQNRLKIDFNFLDIDESDTLVIYDGRSTLSPILMKLNNSNSQLRFSVQSSINNRSAAITFRFISDSLMSGAGWYSIIKCVPLCQKIIGFISTAECSPNLIHAYDSLLRDYVYYLDVCSGENFTIAGWDYERMIFPENDLFYHQNLTNNSFIWDFGNMSPDTGRIVRYHYDNPGGHLISMKIHDTLGCTNINDLFIRVRVSSSPILNTNPVHAICNRDDSVIITIGSNDTSNVVIQPSDHEVIGNNSNFANDSVKLIPDGPSCPTTCTTSSINVTGYSTSMSISDTLSIQSICVNIEHSFLGDLGFRVICPNGQSVVLDPNNHDGGGTFLGEPYGGTNHGAYDNGCDPANNPQGIGWYYCWSQQFETNPTHTIAHAGDSATTGTLEPTNIITNTNYFYPENSLSGLAGCPLIGTWTLEICDDWGIDNGYMFGWSINLGGTSNVQPPWRFHIGIDSVEVINNSVTRIDSSRYLYTNNSVGIDTVTVIVYDDFGCSYLRQLEIQILEVPQFYLVSDTVGCSPIILSVSPGFSGYLWNTEQYTPAISVSNDGVYSVTATNSYQGYSCSSSDSVTVDILPNPKLSGLVKYQGAIVSGILELYNAHNIYDNYTARLNISGQFEFNSILPGTYYLKVTPTQYLYPDYIPCYYNNAFTWWDADTLVLGCAAVRNLVINMQTETDLSSGHGIISGHAYYVYQGNMYPFWGAGIFNQDLNSLALYGIAYTDTAGFYQFDSLPYGNYLIRPEGQYSRLANADTVIYNARNFTFPNRDFYFYEDTIFSYNPLGINEITPDKEQGLIIYPNPAENTLNVYTANTQNNESELTIFDVNGRSLQSSKFSGNKATIDVSRLESGIYFIRLRKSGCFKVAKFIKD